MNPTETSRRDFLRDTTLLGSGLVIAFHLPASASARPTPGADTFAPNAFLRIGKDGSITVVAKHEEMGQGIHTSIAMVICEELGALPEQVKVAFAPVDAAYAHSQFGIQATGGSTSTWTSFDQMRKAGATARAMLITAAAKKLGVPEAELTTEKATVTKRTGGAGVPFAELVDEAAKLEAPKEVKLKDPKEYTIVGKPRHRLDSAIKVRGEAPFSLDAELPGKKVAVVARCPYFGGKLTKLDASKAEKMPGVDLIVEVPSGVAVIGKSFWHVQKARAALVIEWDAGEMKGFSTEKQRADYLAKAGEPGLPARRDGDASKALADAKTKLEAVYEVPYQAHAPMEPLSCTVHLQDGKALIVTGTQFLTLDRGAAAGILGLPPEKVTIQNCYLGGGFGRRANARSDYVSEAAHVALASKKLGAPIQVVWSREDDIQGGFYRPFWLNRLWAGLDADKKLVAWQHRIVGQSILERTPFEPMMVKDGIDATSVEGGLDVPYEIPNVRVELHPIKMPVPVLWWRSVGHSNTAFAKECFFDEVAVAMGKDPVALRKELLGKHPRQLRVLELATQKAGWGSALPEGIGRGVAVHESFAGFCAQVAEVALDKDRGAIVVKRIVAAIDCGPVVNPDQVRAQVESAIVFGLSATLRGQITFADGKPAQDNFDSFSILGLAETPKIEVHIVDTTDAMGGVGEVAVPPVAPAVCNAIYALTKERIRSLPLTRR